MRIFISVLILIFSFQSWTKADSVKDLNIEGFSIGQSLLNYFTKDEILNNTNTDLYGENNKKFASFHTDKPIKLKSYDQYEYLRITYLNNNDFIIHGVTGMRDYEISEMEKCYDLQKKIEISFDEEFSNLDKVTDVFPSKYDSTGESKITAIYYHADDGYAEISCYDFAKHVNIVSGIDVSIATNKLGDWLLSLRKN